MKGKLNEKENLDYFGHKWILAPGGKELVEKCKDGLNEIHYELAAYSALFRNLGNCEFKTEELYGVALSIERMSKTIGELSDSLSKSVAEEIKKS